MFNVCNGDCWFSTVVDILHGYNIKVYLINSLSDGDGDGGGDVIGGSVAVVMLDHVKYLLLLCVRINYLVLL
jgi:hypothetical protein